MASASDLKRRCKELGKDSEFISEFEKSKCFNIALRDIQDVDNVKLINWGCRMLSKSILATHRRDCIIVMTGRQIKVYGGYFGVPDVFSLMYNQITSYKDLSGGTLQLQTTSRDGDLGNGEYRFFIPGNVKGAIRVLNSSLE